MLYIRMGFIMLVNLFLIRLVMEQLGVEDFGIYNVIASVVALCSFIGAICRASAMCVKGANDDAFSCRLSPNIIDLTR